MSKDMPKASYKRRTKSYRALIGCRGTCSGGCHAVVSAKQHTVDRDCARARDDGCTSRQKLAEQGSKCTLLKSFPPLGAELERRESRVMERDIARFHLRQTTLRTWRGYQVKFFFLTCGLFVCLGRSMTGKAAVRIATIVTRANIVGSL